MKRQLWITLSVLTGALLYSWLFWKAPMGINTLIFALFATGIFAVFFPGSFRSDGLKLTAAGVLFSAILVVWNNTPTAKFLHLISFILFVGYSQRRELRFILFAFILGFGSIISAPVSGLHQWATEKEGAGLFRSVWRLGRIVIVPLGLGAIFFLLYSVSNQEFFALFEPLVRFISDLHWPVERTILFVAGFLITGGLLWPTPFGRFLAEADQGMSFQLDRRRKKSAGWLFPIKGMLALKQHYWMALLSLGLLNGLLLVLNLTDLRYVWMDLSEKSAPQLSQYVHSGTNVLIFSILMAILVILFFFHRNLNFYPDNRKLKKLAYLWIGQNAVLALSVAIRNGHYIAQYGLTFKRIGVLAFLALVLYGLWTTFRKIQDRRTVFFLLQRNGWAFYLLLILLATIDWSKAITRYNLNVPSREGIDVDYLLQDHDDHNLTILLQNREKLYPYGQAEEIDRILERKVEARKREFEKTDWRSWNFARERQRRHLLQVE